MGFRFIDELALIGVISFASLARTVVRSIVTPNRSRSRTLFLEDQPSFTSRYHDALTAWVRCDGKSEVSHLRSFASLAATLTRLAYPGVLHA